MLVLSGLTKTYHGRAVLDRVSVSCSSGTILGIVGPNGSGKTTLLNILGGITRPSSGSFQVPPRISPGISRQGFYQDMSVNHNLEVYRRLLKVDSSHLSNQLSNSGIDFGDVLFRKLSAGMKQRVALLVAFLKPCDLLLLDEPTNHLDLDSIFRLRNQVKTTQKAGTTIVFTSHHTADLEKLCDQLLFLKSGSVIHFATTSEVLDQYGSLEEAYQHLFNS